MSWQAATASPRLRRLPEGAGSPLMPLQCGGTNTGALQSPRGPCSPLVGGSLPSPRFRQIPFGSLAENREKSSLPGSPLLPSLSGDTGRVRFGSMTCKNDGQEKQAVGEARQLQGIDPKLPAAESFDTAVRLIAHTANFTAISFVYTAQTP